MAWTLHCLACIMHCWAGFVLLSKSVATFLNISSSTLCLTSYCKGPYMIIGAILASFLTAAIKRPVLRHVDETLLVLITGISCNDVWLSYGWFQACFLDFLRL